jgi:hypothetical protein
MGYGVAMRTRSYRHMSAEDRETLSLGGPWPVLAGDGCRVAASAQHREPRARPHRAARPLSCRHGTDAGDSQGSSTATTAPTPGSLAVAIRADAVGRGLLARADCRTPPLRVASRHGETAGGGDPLWGPGCAASRRCVRRAQRAGLGREGRIAGGRSPL